MNRNRRNKTRNIIAKTIAVTVSAAMIISGASVAWAADTDCLKDENVYVTLQDNGAVSEVYVVNEFTSDNTTPDCVFKTFGATFNVTPAAICISSLRVLYSYTSYNFAHTIFTIIILILCRHFILTNFL